MSHAGICIGGLAAGQFHNSKANTLTVVCQQKLSIERFMKLSSSEAAQQVINSRVEYYTWESFSYQHKGGYVQRWWYWRHDSIEDDSLVLDALFNAYRPVERTWE